MATSTLDSLSFRPSFVLGLALLGAACSGTDEGTDGGALPDSGVVAPADAGPDPVDASAPDAAEPPDAGFEPDAGEVVDAGVEPDAGEGMDATVSPPGQMTLPVTWDQSDVEYGVLGFAGAEDSTLQPDPLDANNTVVRVNRADTADVFAGTTLTFDGTTGFAMPVPLDAENTRMTVRVYTPNVGVRVRLKVEDASDPSATVETEAIGRVANDWETLTFDFRFNAPGTPAFDPNRTYDKASVFFDFGQSGADLGAKTYYFDTVDFLPGSSSTGAFETLDFDRAGVNYTLIGFGGCEDSTVVVDPTDPGNQVARVVKASTAELWGGTTTAVAPLESVPTIPITMSDTQMTARVWTPHAPIQVRLKIEDATDPTRSVETEATATLSETWQTLTFDFSQQAMGTAALNPGYTFNKVSIFFNFGVDGATAGERIYFYDDIAFGP